MLLFFMYLCVYSFGLEYLPLLLYTTVRLITSYGDYGFDIALFKFLVLNDFLHPLSIC